MNLKEFISETLSQIIEGVKDAQEKAKNHGSKVNPYIWKNPENLSRHNFTEASGGEIMQIIDFDVALTATQKKGTKGGIGIFAGGLGIGSQGQSNSDNTSVSRVKFKVPITLPPFKEEDK